VKTLFITVNTAALLLLAAYVAMDTLFAPPQYFSVKRIEIPLLFCLPFLCTLICASKLAPRIIVGIGMAVNAGFALLLIGISLVAILNIAGIAPLVIVTAPSAGVAALNTFVLWKNITRKFPVK
jgi:hypothetical protein